MSDQERGRRRPSKEQYSEREEPGTSSSGRRRREQDSPEEPKPKLSRHDSRERSSSSRSVRDEPTGGSGAGPSTSGSGDAGRRGRRFRDPYDVIHTRPADILNKSGRKDPDPKDTNKKNKPADMNVLLQTNYFKILTTPNWNIYQYHVEFNPPIEMRRLRAGILSEHKALFGGYVYDGLKIFSSNCLDEKLTVLNVTSKKGDKYTITLRFVGVIEGTTMQFLQVLNLIIRRAMSGLKLQLVGRNFFDSHAKIDLREFRLQLWPGYETSIRQHERDVLLCAEIAHKVMRVETIYDILTKCIENSRDYQEDFRRQVLGMTVLTDYNNKTYSISDVDFTKTPAHTFPCKDKDVSFMNYYYDKYHIRIRDPKQPLLISKSKDKTIRGGGNDIIVLVPELCRATGITDNMRNNFQLMRAMADHTRMNPDRRIDRLKAFNQRLQSTAESMNVLKSWNMTLDRRLTEVTGRVMQVQSIQFARNKVSAGENADWNREFRNNALLTTPRNGLNSWSVIATNRSSRELRNFIESLIRSADGMGFRISRPREFLLFDDRNHSYMQAMDNCAREDPQLIFCLVPNNNAERYASIKRKGCLEHGIPTQVVTSKVASNQRGLMSIATKVAIQINCKLGYTPWSVRIPCPKTMVIGYDVCKSSRDKSKAYGALVATMDFGSNTTFFSTVAECSSHDVLANHLWPMMTKALHKYQQEEKKLPSRIFFYRDGVGDGTLAQIYEHEVQDIVQKLNAEYARAEADKPMLAYIIVSKKINTRFFNRNKNPVPGTVVDDVVTLPERYDFFLVSQSVRQGTVTPTNYNIIHSNIGLNPEYIQLMTYKMCHLYYNWAGTTRVPAVCQYAQKLATLVATSLYQPPLQTLEKKLFYL